MMRHRKRAEAMTAPRPRFRKPKQLDAGIFQAEISSFALRLAAEGKAAKTIRTYTEAVQWFAAYLLEQASRASWEQVDCQDIQLWMAWLLDRYSNAYASNQYRALQQFFKWLAAEDELPDPMAGLQPPRVTEKLVPVFTGDELSRLEQACAGRAFTQRRDTAIIAVFKATGIRLSELADLRCDPGDPRRSDVDLWQREITVRGKGDKDRIVRIGHQTARSLDRYLRARSRHAQAWRPQLWLGAGNREPLTAAGIYQMIARRGRQCGVDAYPHRFRHHFSHTWLDRGGPEEDLMELNGWASPQMLRRYGATAPAPAAPAPAAPTTASWTTCDSTGRDHVAAAGRRHREAVRLNRSVTATCRSYEIADEQVVIPGTGRRSPVRGLSRTVLSVASAQTRHQAAHGS
jgi:site-specific recombinase XerD